MLVTSMPTPNTSSQLWVLDTLKETANYFQTTHATAYLVGGSVRNVLLGEPCVDWDIVVPSDNANIPRITRQLANHLGGFYAHLNDKASRVIVKQAGQELVIDISSQQGTIEEDLHQRDFTLNAIAVPLQAIVQTLTTHEKLNYIDPNHGIVDLKAHRLRLVTDSAFQKDPLRILRAIRLMARYDLTIETTTEQKIIRDAHLLPHSAPERIHEELYAILRQPGTITYLRYMDKHGVLTTLIPEFIPARGMLQPSLHHWDVLDHSLETVAALEKLAHILQQTPAELLHSPLDLDGTGDMLTLQQLLQEAEKQGLFTLASLVSPQMKLAALIHDIGKTTTYAMTEDQTITFYHHPQAGIPLAQQIMKRLNISTQDRHLVQLVVAHHMRPGQLSQDTVTPRAIRRYFVDLGPTGINVALVALADHLSMRGPEPLTIHWQRHLATVCQLLNTYLHEREKIIPPRLLQAEELIRRLNLTPGPIIGQLLESIAEAQAEGHVRSKEEALWFAAEKLRTLQCSTLE